jgi:hypothetical protein
MRKTETSYRRRAEILRLLSEHGPLSVHGLKRMLIPCMSSKGIALSLNRLRKRGYIVRRFDSLPNNVGHFYQLSCNQNVRKDISNIIGMDISALDDPPIHDQELYHSQQCAIWAHHLKRLYPEAKIVRDYKILKDEESKKALLMDLDRIELRPDIMMFFPKTTTSQKIILAIEIERTRKANRRIIDKLKKFANTTFTDGLLYICDDDSLSEIIRQLYNKNVRERALRLAYKTNYLMLMQKNFITSPEQAMMFNADLQNVSFADWIHFLKSTERNFRRDHKIQVSVNAPTLEPPPL